MKVLLAHNIASDCKILFIICFVHKGTIICTAAIKKSGLFKFSALKNSVPFYTLEILIWFVF